MNVRDLKCVVLQLVQAFTLDIEIVFKTDTTAIVTIVKDGKFKLLSEQHLDIPILDSMFNTIAKHSTNLLIVNWSTFATIDTLKIVNTWKFNLKPFFFKQLSTPEPKEFVFNICELISTNILRVSVSKNGNILSDNIRMIPEQLLSILSCMANLKTVDQDIIRVTGSTGMMHLADSFNVELEKASKCCQQIIPVFSSDSIWLKVEVYPQSLLEGGTFAIVSSQKNYCMVAVPNLEYFMSSVLNYTRWFGIKNLRVTVSNLKIEDFRRLVNFDSFASALFCINPSIEYQVNKRTSDDSQVREYIWKLMAAENSSVAVEFKYADSNVCNLTRRYQNEVISLTTDCMLFLNTLKEFTSQHGAHVKQISVFVIFSLNLQLLEKLKDFCSELKNTPKVNCICKVARNYHANLY